MKKIYECNTLHTKENLKLWTKHNIDNSLKGFRIFSILFLLLFILTLFTKKSEDDIGIVIMTITIILAGNLGTIIAQRKSLKTIMERYEMIADSLDCFINCKISDKVYFVSKDEKEIEKKKEMELKDIIRVSEYKNWIILMFKGEVFIPFDKDGFIQGNWKDCYEDLKSIAKQNKKNKKRKQT